MNRKKKINKIIAAISDCISLEPLQITPSSVLSFPGLEIKQSQHRVFLASNPGIVLSQEQIFEAVWNMDSDNCHSNVAGGIYNLRKKIEPDSKNTVYIKTVLGIGYKFSG